MWPPHSGDAKKPGIYARVSDQIEAEKMSVNPISRDEAAQEQTCPNQVLSHESSPESGPDDYPES